MKYGITAWCFPNSINSVKFAAMAGYEGIQVETGSNELGYYMTDPIMRALYLEETKRFNIEIISVVDNDLMHVGCQGKKNEAEYVKAFKAIELTIETAKALNCKRIMLPMFYRSQIYSSRPDTVERAAEILQYTCKRAKEDGILVQVETSVDAKTQIELMKMVDEPNLTNYYDSQNLYWYEGIDALKELPTLIPLNGPEMHICDGWGLMTPDANGGKLLGTGDTHFEEQIKIICDSKWDGWLIVENGYYLPSLRGKGNYLELAKKDLLVLKNTIRKYSENDS